MKASVQGNKLTIVDINGSTMSIEIEKGVFQTENSEMTLKDKQYVLNISKFIRTFSVEHMSNKISWTKRFEKFAKVINEQKSNNFRNLSSAIRRAFDDNIVLPRSEYQTKFFYEGGMKAIEVAEVA